MEYNSKIKKREAVFQILMMLLSIFAFSYFAYETIKEVKIVEAAPFLNCCSELKDGSTCQDLTNDECAADCSGSCIPTSCPKSIECKLGCCIGGKYGSCDLNSPKAKCEAGGGKWKDNSACNFQECEKKCCVLGDEAKFVNEKECEVRSEGKGVEKDFRQDVVTEIECLALANSQVRGACIVGLNEQGYKDCNILTKQECLGITQDSGAFSENYLCSNPELNTSCEKQDRYDCVDGKDETYWFDSCGNRENIWSSDKNASWNNGMILTKEESCNSESSNAGSKECGNCNYFLGSRCGIENNKAVCKDMNCPNAEGNGEFKDRVNGESWCVYDGYVGKGKGTVGSRHWKRICIDGEIKVEPCEDYRNGLCAEAEVNGISSATCRPNRAHLCLSGEKNSDCYTRKFDFDDDYEFSLTLPKYPLGFNLRDNKEAAEEICSQAKFKCVKVEQKKLFGGWECIAGCDCDEWEFTRQINNWCISLGDCGVQVNWAGKGTTGGLIIKKAEKISWGPYATYIEPVKGQKVSVGDSIKYAASALGGSYKSGNVSLEEITGSEEDEEEKIPSGTPDYDKSEVEFKDVFKVIGAAGILLGINLAMGAGALLHKGIPLSSMTWGYSPTAPTAASAGFSTSGINWVGYGNNLLGLAIGAVIGGIVAKVAGLKGDAVIATIGAGAIGGTAGSIFGSPLGWGPLWGAAFWALAAAIVAAIILKMMGVGDIKKTKYKVACKPWVPPYGGGNCEKCNEDPLKPCSEYRCESLGMACEFINIGAENPICIWSNKNDATPPKITPLYGNITPGYKYNKVSDNSFWLSEENGDCIQENKEVLFGLETDEFAECRLDYEHKTDFEEMEISIGNSYLKKEHLTSINIPSKEAIIYNLKDGVNFTQEQENEIKSILTKELGNQTWYARCVDKNGNGKNTQEFAIKFCIRPGPDLTAPEIIKTEPATPAYLKYGAEESNLSIWVKEEGGVRCKYDKENKEYEDMKNDFTCEDKFEDAESYGYSSVYKCLTDLSGLNKTENKIYIRCKDQPWFAGTINESDRNVNAESFVYTLFGSASALEIEDIEPNEDFEISSASTAFDLVVKTKGGAENGKAYCSYKYGGYWNLFYETGLTIHKQEDYHASEGRQQIDIKCEDIAGNVAEGSTKFKIIHDTSPPQVARVFVSGGDIKIITTEDSECRYSIKTCRFNFDDGVDMGGGAEHSVALSEKTYYVKCKDEHGNYPSGCSIIVRGINYI